MKKIQDSIATRDLIFENDYKNTIDICFDDSELLSHTNFSFVKIDSKYDCKIFLFGKEDNVLPPKSWTRHISERI
ncbi:hypothetical protein [Streptococcus equi]|uniref:hypothetical protein n=1 Tax=Streptococcus equi TaxID=1336 RepID=UPI001D11E848|nr:hypothetical protein [Streptococcus equi]MDI5989449.1 hypothetical protein [Streptococcus equi subsp. zooepidemicus]